MTAEIRDRDYVSSEIVTSPLGDRIIAVRDLSVAYDGKQALKSVSATISSNEIVAIMGRNGAGKSSLLKSLAGISELSTGSVDVAGHNPQNLKGKERRTSIGFIPQEPSDLLYGQSVQIECEQADKDNQIPSGTTAQILNQLVPGVSATTHPRDLSEGQRLGLALSIVLSSNPAVLILDEPTRGLDYQAKKELIKILIDFARATNKCVVLATHDVELVAELATRVMFLADGDIVADGSTLEVLLSSPAFAPQVSKVMSPQPWLKVSDVVAAIEAHQ
jgi:energy-coupling factor transport system ATP-binding protein